MGQKLRDDKIGALSHSSGVITLTSSTASPSWLTIGGQQYKLTSNVARTIATDVTMTTNARYQVFAVVVSGVVQLRISSNNDLVGPTGFTSWKLLSPFSSNASSLFGAFASGVNPLTNTIYDTNPVGMIVASMLTEAQFQSLNGSNWVLAYGQNISGSAYASITGISTAPDLRGRTLAGVDNMGGVAANRLTPGGSGITGTTLGAVGGAETHVLSVAQLPSHDHTQFDNIGGTGGGQYGLCGCELYCGSKCDNWTCWF